MLLGEDGYYVVSFLVAFEFLQSRDIGSKLVGMSDAQFERFRSRCDAFPKLGVS